MVMVCSCQTVSVRNLRSFASTHPQNMWCPWQWLVFRCRCHCCPACNRIAKEVISIMIDWIGYKFHQKAVHPSLNTLKKGLSLLRLRHELAGYNAFDRCHNQRAIPTIIARALSSTTQLYGHKYYNDKFSCHWLLVSPNMSWRLLHGVMDNRKQPKLKVSYLLRLNLLTGSKFCNTNTDLELTQKAARLLPHCAQLAAGSCCWMAVPMCRYSATIAQLQPLLPIACHHVTALCTKMVWIWNFQANAQSEQLQQHWQSNVDIQGFICTNSKVPMNAHFVGNLEYALKMSAEGLFCSSVGICPEDGHWRFCSS